MDVQDDSDDDFDDVSSIDSDTTTNSCECPDCSRYRARTIYGLPMPLREGDGLRKRDDALSFMMQVRRRKRFPLLRLPTEIRFLILRELLFHDGPIDWEDDFDEEEEIELHPAILATCHQLHQEGSVILLSHNKYSMMVNAWDYGNHQLRWLGAVHKFGHGLLCWPEIFQKLSKLEVVINVYHDSLQELTTFHCEGYKMAMYLFVDLIQSRANRLCHLGIYCNVEPDCDDPPPQTYQPDAISADQTTEEQARTQEEYILEPLANLKGSAKTLVIGGMSDSCKQFLERRMDQLGEDTLGRTVKTDYGVYLD